MDRRTDSFKVRTQDGRVFDVLEFTAQIDVSSHDNPGATMDGLKRLVTAEGYTVNRKSSTEYEIVSLGMVKATRI